MVSLCRTKQGIFDIKDSNSLNDILKDNYKTISYDEIFKDYYKVDMTDDEYFKVKNGQHMENNYNQQEVLFMYHNKYIALYELKDNTLKIKLMFN
jgi:tRNA U55 pseudouridine synthase TruB